MPGDAFQKLKSSVNRGITTISVKTSSTIEKTKIKTHIDTLKKEIEGDLSAVGEDAYKIWSSNCNDFSSLTPQFELIQKKQKEILDLTEELSSIDIRDQKILGTASEKGKNSPKLYVCKHCNAQFDSPAKFCGICGNKTED